MHLLIFIMTTILFWGFSIAFTRFMLIAVSEGQMLDVLFNWQKLLNKLYGGNRYVQLLGKFLGECDVCLMHHMSIWSFICYAVISIKVNGIWISDSVESMSAKILVNIIWYFVFVMISWYLNLKINSKTPE